MPRISVVVPVYNAEKYINRCVDSILNQSFRDFEIILVDDGSTDSSGNICDEYAKMHEEVTVIHKKNGGASDARNTGLDAATGEYAIFIDSDDFIEEKTFEKLLEVNTDNYDVIMCSIKIVKKDNEVTECVLPNDIYTSREIMTMYVGGTISRMCVLAPWNKLYNINFLRSNNLKFDKSIVLGEDMHFNMSCYEKSGRIVTVSDMFYNYMRENENSIMNSFQETTYDDNRRIHYRTITTLNALSCPKETIEEYIKLYLKGLIGTTVRAILYGNDSLTKRYIKDISKDKDLIENIKLLKSDKAFYLAGSLVIRKKYCLALFLFKVYASLKHRKYKFKRK